MKNNYIVLGFVSLLVFLSFIIFSNKVVQASAPTSGLVGYWKFDEGSGTTASDSSGVGNNGTLVNTPTWADGKIGKALQFNGVNKYVNIPGFSLTSGSPVTVSFWMKTSGTGGSAFGSISTTGRFQTHAPWTDNTLYWDYGNYTTTGRIATPFGANLNKWTHVTLISAGTSGNLKAIYINGSLAASGTSSDGATGVTGLTIGAWATNNLFFNGAIDEFRVYNRALSSGEVLDIYNDTGTPPDTVSPNVSMTSPQDNATVSGSAVAVSAIASDDIGVAGVQFKLNGTNIGVEDTSFPYSIDWNSTFVANGAYSITASARDAYGNSSLSSPVAITVSNTTPPPSAGLIASYSFDEESGTTASDSSSSGFNGTLVGSPTRVAGKYGNALQFGTGKYVNIPTFNLPSGSAVTVSFWAKTLGAGGSAFGTGGTGQRFQAHLPWTDNNLYWDYGSYTGTGRISTYYGTSLNNWTYVTLVSSGSGNTFKAIYLNGVLTASVSNSNAPTSNISGLNIGGWVLNNHYYNGVIDEFRVFNRVLTQSEIVSEMNKGGVVEPPAEPPVITITSPIEGASFPNTTNVNVTYQTSGDLEAAEVHGIHFSLDGGPEQDEEPFDGAFTLTNVPAGSHTLKVFFMDEYHSKIASSETQVHFTTTIDDSIPPTVNITAPADSSTISGVVSVSASANDNAGILGVQFLIDGVAVNSEIKNSPYSFLWNTASVSNGNHAITAVVRDLGGNTATSSPVNLAISNLNPNDPAVIGQWSSVMNWPLVPIHVTLQKDGKVLMWDDHTTDQGAQIYDPIANTMTAVPYNPANLFCSGHVTGSDGKIMVIGGQQSAAYMGIKDLTVFDTVTKTWSAKASMAYGRWYPTATMLSDGKILATSGSINCSDCENPNAPHNGLAPIPEVYNPATNTWKQLVNASYKIPMYPHMFLLTDGRVVNTGSQEEPIATKVLDLNAEKWSVVDARVLDGGSAVMYGPNKIMESGTSWNPGYPVKNASNSTHVLDMSAASPAWRETAPMTFPRTQHNLVVLPDGNVLAIGGGSNTQALDASNGVLEAEMWSPTTETWKTMAPMHIKRNYHSTAILLPDGRVLEAGGGRWGPNQMNAEIYSPPYLFKGERPVISSAPYLPGYNNQFTVSTPDASRISKVSLVRLGSVTHAFDQEQRFINLDFQKNANTLTVTSPLNSHFAPPGYYMLFIIDSNGVPSIAYMVKLVIPSDSTVPSTPTGLSNGETSAFQINLSWNASTDNFALSGYKIFRNGVQVGTTTLPAFTDNSVVANTNYSYTVSAFDLAGNVSTLSSPLSVSSSALPNSLPGLLASFSFDEISGLTASDSSGLGNTGTLINNPVRVPGKFGNGLQFNGINNYVNVPMFSLPSGSPVTVSFWAKVLGAGGSAFGTPGTSQRLQAHLPYIDNTLYWDYGDYASGGRLATPYANYLNKWTYVTLSSSGTGNISKEIYLNGNLITSANSSNGPGGAVSGLNIGAWAQNNLYLNGIIDEFRVYNRLLTQSEIVNEMNRGSEVASTTLPKYQWMIQGDSNSDPAFGEVAPSSMYMTTAFGHFGATSGNNIDFTGTSTVGRIWAKAGGTIICPHGSVDKQMTNQQSSLIAAFTGQVKILTIMVGTNDMLSVADGGCGLSASTFVSQLKTYAQNLKAAVPGLKIIIVPTPPNSTSGFNAVRNAANAAIAADPSFYDLYISSLANDTTIWCDSCSLNTTYYNGLHGTAAWHALLAPYIESAVAQFMQ